MSQATTDRIAELEQKVSQLRGYLAETEGQLEIEAQFNASHKHEIEGLKLQLLQARRQRDSYMRTASSLNKKNSELEARLAELEPPCNLPIEILTRVIEE